MSQTFQGYVLARTDLASLVGRFAARLRREGLPVGPERSARFAAAVDLAEPQTTQDLYWCGLATLVGVFFIPMFYVLLQRVSEGQWPFRRPDPGVPIAGGGAPASAPAAPER